MCPMNPRLLRPLARSGDSDVRNYIAAVEAADTQPLEQAVKDAYRDFIVGCKQDGIWDAIKASCILAGARTLAGALVPLKGAAPTNNGPFVTGDYNRETGLVGNGSTKYLTANRNEDADGLNDNHYAAWSTTLGTGVFIGNTGTANTTISQAATRNRSISADLLTAVVGFIGISRSAGPSYTQRTGGANYTAIRDSATAGAATMGIFATGTGGSLANHRLAFYSMGSSLNLSQLDSRINTLITAIGNAI